MTVKEETVNADPKADTGEETREENPFLQFKKKDEEKKTDKPEKESVKETSNDEGKGENSKPDNSEKTSKVKVPEQYDGTEEEWNAMSKEDQADWKLENQSKNAQKKITEFSERVYKTEKAFCKVEPRRLEELAKGDEKEVKMAKKLAKEIYGVSLKEALQEIEDWRKENGDEEDSEPINKEKLREELKREMEQEKIENDFVKNNPIIDKSSEEFEKEVRTLYEEKLNGLKKVKDDILTSDELQDLHEDALALAMRKSPKKGKANIAKKEKQIATAGSGASRSRGKGQGKDNNPFSGLPKRD